MPLQNVAKQRRGKKDESHSHLNFFITIYSIQYKYIKEIKITKQTKNCGEGDNQKRKSTILGMSPHY